MQGTLFNIENTVQSKQVRWATSKSTVDFPKPDGYKHQKSKVDFIAH